MISSLDNYIFGLSQSSKSYSDTLKYASEKIAKNYSKKVLIDVQRELNILRKPFTECLRKTLAFHQTLIDAFAIQLSIYRLKFEKL